jgi:hypothetical protein
MHRVLGLSQWVLLAAARALILSLSVAVLGPVLHGAHDDVCDPGVAVHDESQHSMRSARTTDGGSPDGDHCVACHFARASRGPVAWEPTGVTALADGVLLYHSDGRLFAGPVAVPVPARAPPRA